GRKRDASLVRMLQAERMAELVQDDLITGRTGCRVYERGAVLRVVEIDVRVRAVRGNDLIRSPTVGPANGGRRGHGGVRDVAVREMDIGRVPVCNFYEVDARNLRGVRECLAHGRLLRGVERRRVGRQTRAR